MILLFGVFFFSSRRRHTRFKCDWSSDVCSSDLVSAAVRARPVAQRAAFEAQISTEVLRQDQSRSSVAARLAPKKYGDHISHDGKGPGPNFPPAIPLTPHRNPRDPFTLPHVSDASPALPL